MFGDAQRLYKKAKVNNDQIHKQEKMFLHVIKCDYYATVIPTQCYKIATDLSFIFQ